MMRTLLTIVITALVTSTSLRRGVEGVWLMSAVKAPGRMALESVEADLDSGRIEIAKRKLAALRTKWEVFEDGDGSSGEAIGDIMVNFGRIEGTPPDPDRNEEPAGPSKPAR